MLDTHTISYVVFQTMFALFLASPFANTTAEGDYISLPPKHVTALLNQPKTAALRYYFTLTPSGKISAVIVAVDSTGAENRRIMLNAKNQRSAETGIASYESKKMDKQTGTRYGTIGISYDATGKMHADGGKAQLLQLAETAHEIRAFYCMKTETKNLVLVFAATDKRGKVGTASLQSTEDKKLIDNSFECPPFCR